MINFLYNMPDTLVFLSLSLLLIAASIASIYVIGRIIPLHVRLQDNAVIGSVSQLIGVIYGVLASLMALYLLNNISYTADAVQQEANAIRDIYRSTKWLKDPSQTAMQQLLKNYVNEVINVEWPLMKEGRPIDDTGEIILDKISTQMRQYPLVNNSDNIIVTRILDDIKSLNNAREQRIHMSYAELNGEIWVVIWVGTLLVLAVNFLFAMNILLHIIVVSGASLMASSMIFLLVTLDKPFQGEFVIEPDAFAALIHTMDNDSQVKAHV